jgi:hypothetical protein
MLFRCRVLFYFLIFFDLWSAVCNAFTCKHQMLHALFDLFCESFVCDDLQI